MILFPAEISIVEEKLSCFAEDVEMPCEWLSGEYGVKITYLNGLSSGSLFTITIEGIRNPRSMKTTSQFIF